MIKLNCHRSWCCTRSALYKLLEVVGEVTSAPLATNVGTFRYVFCVRVNVVALRLLTRHYRARSLACPSSEYIFVHRNASEIAIERRRLCAQVKHLASRDVHVGSANSNIGAAMCALFGSLKRLQCAVSERRSGSSGARPYLLSACSLVHHSQRGCSTAVFQHSDRQHLSAHSAEGPVCSRCSAAAATRARTVSTGERYNSNVPGIPRSRSCVSRTCLTS